jgi:hypothetical protein
MQEEDGVMEVCFHGLSIYVSNRRTRMEAAATKRRWEALLFREYGNGPALRSEIG